MSTAADRNLLFGILAVQMEFASQEQLLAGMNSWVLDKGKPLGEHLVAGGALSRDTYQLLSALVDKHIEQHGGKIQQSLAAAAPNGPLHATLAKFADADVQTSLALAAQAAPRPGDRHATLAPAPAPADEQLRFQVLRPHARGGLGQVSVARDAELNREVALKELLDSHADDANSRARFLQEAEITGGLEHPGVVPIYALGQYSDGRPFYAMRFIRGDSLRDAIERFHRQADPQWQDAATQIQLRRLLGRMIDVCNAIEYAHNRGVLHRDLKPGNVMLGQYGETLVVDWGLAKVMGKTGAGTRAPVPSATETTILHQAEPLLTPTGGSAPTQMGAALGTPAFMSPEQAAGRIDQLGPASDIYSLGATLYMLLTGRAPQSDDDLGIVLLRVQRGDFPAPRAVKPVVPRPLEAICTKAMALEPADRYASARALADDLEAWLADEPIAALPEPWTARTRRWVKKHRALVSTVAGVVLASLAAALLGVVVLTAANRRERAAKESAQVAEQKARQAEDRALAAKGEADRQSERNTELLQLARSSLERYETLSKSELLQHYGMESLRGDLQEAALQFYETLARQAGESEEARADRANALYRIGATYWQLGRLDDGLAAHQQARAIYEQLERDFPDNADYRRKAAVSNGAVGEHLVNTQQAEAAAPLLAASRERLQSLLQADPRDAETAALLAYGWGLEGERQRQLGQFEEAAEYFSRGVAQLRETLQLPLENSVRREMKLRLARALNQHATLVSQTLWQFEPARADYAEAREILSEQFAARPEFTDVGWNLAQIIRNQAELFTRNNQVADARQAYGEAIDLMTTIDRQVPNVPHYRFELAQLLLGAAGLPPAGDGPDKSRATPQEQLQQAVRIVEQLAEQAPARTDFRLVLARCRAALGHALNEQSRSVEAQEQFDEAVVLLTQLMQNAERNVDNLANMAFITDAVAQQLQSAGQYDEALALLQHAEDEYAAVLELAPNYAEIALALANLHVRRAEIFGEQFRWVDAIKELDAMRVLSEELKGRSDALWMQTGFRMLEIGGATTRQLYVTSLRSGNLTQVAEAGQYQTLLQQATAWGPYTGEASDHYAAAEGLAFGAGFAATDERLEPDQQTAIADTLAEAAVRELAAAFDGGYIRRSGGMFGVLSGKPTLDDLQDDAQWAPVRDRADFQQLLARIAESQEEDDDKAPESTEDSAAETLEPPPGKGAAPAEPLPVLPGD